MHWRDQLSKSPPNRRPKDGDGALTRGLETSMSKRLQCKTTQCFGVRQGAITESDMAPQVVDVLHDCVAARRIVGQGESTGILQGQRPAVTCAWWASKEPNASSIAGASPLPD